MTRPGSGVSSSASARKIDRQMTMQHFFGDDDYTVPALARADSEARARRGCAAHGAKLYRVQCIRGTSWVTRHDAAKRIAASSRRAGLASVTIDRVTLTARLSPKTLALALLNNDDIAFARVERIET